MSSGPNLFPSSAHHGVEAGTFGGRNYDYTLKYRPDKPGEGGKENARAWNVYLDEAENYDADMIQEFRNIIDGLLVFASLFSAVVTSFVAQTSQALQPNNTQIVSSLLFETNQLLRATANGISVDAVPSATLAPGSVTRTSTDLWVNGFFFTSLALSLSTALLTVLAKQWIQAYTSIVPGGAKTRALIRHFRFQGILKWRLGTVIECLPLILHGSVAIFLVGLSLYVSQLSSPICAVVAFITIIAFIFYFGTSMLPALFIECPYRIPFAFPLANVALFAFYTVKCTFLWLLELWTSPKVSSVRWPVMIKDSLKNTENNSVFPRQDGLPDDVFFDTCLFTCDALDWMFDYSSNQSVKEVVAEALSGLLSEWQEYLVPVPPEAPMVSEADKLLKHNIIPHATLISLDKILDMKSSFTDGSLKQDVWGRLISLLSEASGFFEFKLPFGDPDAINDKPWREQLQDALQRACLATDQRGDYVLFRHLLHLGGPAMLKLTESEVGKTILHEIAYRGSVKGIHSILDFRSDVVDQRDGEGLTALHYAAMNGKLDAVMALVDKGPSLESFKTDTFETVLDTAHRFAHTSVVEYLLDHAADKFPYALHQAVDHWDVDLVRVLLDKGWSPSCENERGRTPLDIANALPNDARFEIVTLLQQEQAEHWESSSA